LIALNSGLTVLYQCITVRGAKVDNHGIILKNFIKNISLENRSN
jgi:hypothetical protein